MSVYFAQRRQQGLIKIGWSRGVPDRSQSVKAKMLGAVAGDRSTEAALHARFAHLRVSGDWFRPGSDLLAFIQGEVREYKPDSETVQARIRLEKSLLDRTDKLAKKMRLTWADLLQMAVHRGLDQIEAEGKKR